jgi:hypothetical protein
MATSTYATDYRAIDGGTWAILQGHADYCAEHGHAAYTVDGVVRYWCPRCDDAVA